VEGTGMSIDNLDRKIISLLQPDGRRPFSDIAAELNVSEGTVRQRYQRLVSAGALQIVGVADPFKIGFQSMAMIGINVAIDSGRTVSDVAEDIAEFPEVSYVLMSTGRFDLLAEVIMESNAELVEFLEEKLHHVVGVTKTETFMVLRVYKMKFGGWRVLDVSSDGKGRRAEETQVSSKPSESRVRTKSG
jgi:Lrp/AsnC family transcriptional regulator for asnA, asnC and gidA